MSDAPAIDWQRIQHSNRGDTYAARFGAGWLVRFREVIPSDNDALVSSMVYVPDAQAFPSEEVPE